MAIAKADRADVQAGGEVSRILQRNEFGCALLGKSLKRLVTCCFCQTLGLTFFAFLIGFHSALVCWAEAPIELRRADLLRTEQGPVGIIRYLDGDVWITQDTLSITGDHAVYDEAAGQLLFTGNVHFSEPARQFWADQATYYERDGRATAEGNVRIEQDSVVITCDKVVYHEARREANLVGAVRIHSLREKAVLTGNLGNYGRQDEHGAMTQNPRLVRYFSDEDSMVVTGRVIDYRFGQKSALVTDSVHLQRNDFDAWGQRLAYQEEGEWARLTGNPLLQRKQEVMRADTVDAYFQNERIRRVLLYGRAAASAPVDSLRAEPENRITGKQMELLFKGGELDSIHVRGNATSVYYVREKEEKRGANKVSGDVIDLWMKNGQINWIYVEGGTEGIFYPQQLENLVQSEEGPALPPQRNLDWEK